jgi:predicted glycosyltransferase
MQTWIERDKAKKIWIDLDNSPHVPFFFPIIQKFEEKGHMVHITARDCFQVCGLADLHKLKYRRVGKHYGKNKILKITGTVIRALQLVRIALKAKPDIAISHGSRAMLIAARILKIPSVGLGDYEFARVIPFIRADLWIAPEVVAKANLTSFKWLRATFPGIKEDVYVPFFRPDDSLNDDLKLGEDKIIVTIRPPATEAHYHNPDSEGLFSEVLDMLGVLDKVKMIILPRNEIKQTAWIKERWPDLIKSEKIVIPNHVVDGLNLIWHSDLVVSGGGTMNREAAALGVPVYSIFRGRIGAVDRYLESKGRLTLLESKDDVRTKINLRKRDKIPLNQNNESPALNSIMELLYGVLNRNDTKNALVVHLATG